MTSNLTLWDQFADIDPAYTKPITGKPYKGTSPNPHYVVRCLTEMFGPVGVGFGWEVIAEGFQPLGDEVLHWCRIRFWHGEGRGFESYGQTKALMMTGKGPRSDEDAPKKSLTDAITKAAAQVGVGANIFLGRWDDNRYVQQVADEYRAKENAPANKDTFDRIAAKMREQTSLTDLERFARAKNVQQAVAALPVDMQAKLEGVLNECRGQLKPEPPREVA